jgi:hypothetical protein
MTDSVRATEQFVSLTESHRMGVCHSPTLIVCRDAPQHRQRKYRCTLKLDLPAAHRRRQSGNVHAFCFVEQLAKQTRMKLHHLAGITLVGWCLIMPPLSQDRQQVEKDAPLSRWDTVGNYLTSTGCKDELAKLTTVISGNINLSVIQRRVLAGKCVAADDPRLHADNFEMY